MDTKFDHFDHEADIMISSIYDMCISWAYVIWMFLEDSFQQLTLFHWLCLGSIFPLIFAVYLANNLLSGFVNNKDGLPDGSVPQSQQMRHRRTSASSVRSRASSVVAKTTNGRRGRAKKLDAMSAESNGTERQAFTVKAPPNRRRRTYNIPEDPESSFSSNYLVDSGFESEIRPRTTRYGRTVKPVDKGDGIGVFIRTYARRRGRRSGYHRDIHHELSVSNNVEP